VSRHDDHEPVDVKLLSPSAKTLLMGLAKRLPRLLVTLAIDWELLRTAWQCQNSVFLILASDLSLRHHKKGKSLS
ncbi:hypothetical protein, partial [Ferrimicrobium sp.]|uniref:hypothetical protein n=1 Tax=Ferrimicrobium sp. TaxID=2926050 RepID=UPI00262515EB